MCQGGQGNSTFEDMIIKEDNFDVIHFVQNIFFSEVGESVEMRVSGNLKALGGM